MLRNKLEMQPYFLGKETQKSFFLQWGGDPVGWQLTAHSSWHSSWSGGLLFSWLHWKINHHSGPALNLDMSIYIHICMLCQPSCLKSWNTCFPLNFLFWKTSGIHKRSNDSPPRRPAMLCLDLQLINILPHLILHMHKNNFFFQSHLKSSHRIMVLYPKYVSMNHLRTGAFSSIITAPWSHPSIWAQMERCRQSLCTFPQMSPHYFFLLLLFSPESSQSSCIVFNYHVSFLPFFSRTGPPTFVVLHNIDIFEDAMLVVLQKIPQSRWSNCFLILRFEVNIFYKNIHGWWHVLTTVL